MIAQKDRHLAAYLGISIDTRKADAEIEAAKMQAERLRLETQRLRERNERAAKTRERSRVLAALSLRSRRRCVSRRRRSACIFAASISASALRVSIEIPK